MPVMVSVDHSRPDCTGHYFNAWLAADRWALTGAIAAGPVSWRALIFLITSMRTCPHIFIAVILVASVFPVTLHAQENDAIDEIQVTATRRPVDQRELSTALTLIPGQEVRSGKLTTDALATKIGVFLQQTTPGQGAAIVRGLKGSEVLHLVDGMRLNNAIFRNAPTQYLALVSPATVERIEIVRGSPASLYGSDAVGGVIQVITRTPAFESSGLSFRGDLGVAFDTAELGKSVRASFEAGTRKVAGLVSVDYLETGNRRVGGGERIGPSSYQSKGGRAAFSITPNEQVSWLFDFQSVRQPETPRIDELVPGFGQVEPSSAEFVFEPNGRDFAHIRHSRRQGLLNADWTIDLGWQRIIDDRRTRKFGTELLRTESNESDLFGVAVIANRVFDHHSWVAGAEFYHDIVASSRAEQDLRSGDIDQIPSRFPDGSSVDQASVFVSLGLDISAHHSLNGGLRYSEVKVQMAETALSTANRVSTGDLSTDLGWRFQFSETSQLVANMSFGFRAPNVFDLGALGERPGNRFNVPNADLRSEHVTMLEAGIKRHSNHTSAEFFVWFLDYDDRLASVLTGEVTPGGRDVVQTRNQAGAQIWGFEALLRYVLSNRSQLELILNQTRGEQRTTDGEIESADRIPPFNGRLGIEVELLPALLIEPYVVFAAKQDRLSSRDVRDVRIDPRGTAAWVTVNLLASWRAERNWSIDVGMHNITDKRYRSHGSGIDAPGRNLFMNVRYSW